MSEEYFKLPVPYTIGTKGSFHDIELCNGWSVSVEKSPISNSAQIDALSQETGIAMPEMIFGQNKAVIEYGMGQEKRFGLEFNAKDALLLVDKNSKVEDLLKVAYSEEWRASRDKEGAEVMEVIKPFDWTYSTAYKGTLCSEEYVFQPTIHRIPIEELKKPDPILFYEEVMLYEDELADNGTAVLSMKLRVMPKQMLLLCRFFLRLDNVVFRVRDTRVYVNFHSRIVLREYVAKEDAYAHVKSLVPRQQDVGAYLRDSNWVAERLSIKEEVYQEITIK